MAKKKGTNTGIPGVSFSAKRATGITNAKRKVAKATGIPTTKSGRQRKVGKAATGGGCLIPIIVVISVICMAVVAGCSSQLSTAESTTDDVKTYTAKTETTIPKTTAQKPSTTAAVTTQEPTTEPPTTEKPTEPPTDPPTEAEEEYDLIVVNWTNTVEAGSEASVTIQGKPNTKYSIAVFYHSGTSDAKGLEAKTSDDNGNVTWTWKVGSRTEKDTYDITISGDGKHETIEFTVI